LEIEKEKAKTWEVDCLSMQQEEALSSYYIWVEI
jgi:hypothetical protein